MQTSWFIVRDKEGLALAIPDVEHAGDPPYLLIDLGGNVLVFDFHAMLGMLEGFNGAIEQRMVQLEEQKAALLEQQEGADVGS